MPILKTLNRDFRLKKRKTRGQIQVSCQQRISTCTIDRIQLKLNEHHGLYVSRSTIYNLKPFFIKNPTEKEKDLGLHKDCLNTRLIFNSLMDHSVVLYSLPFPFFFYAYFLLHKIWQWLLET